MDESASRPTAAGVIEMLDLEPLPGEGGWFRRTYCSDESLAAAALPGRYTTDRALATAIYYLITPDSFSALHRLPGDEIFHFYQGDPLIQLQLLPNGASQTLELGPELTAGQRPQIIAPRGCWQATFLQHGGEWALLGATNAPGFDDEDLELPDPDELLSGWPDRAEMIRRLLPR